MINIKEELGSWVKGWLNTRWSGVHALNVYTGQNPRRRVVSVKTSQMRTICTLIWRESCRLVYIFTLAFILGRWIFLDIYFHKHWQSSNIQKETTPKNIKVTPAVWDRYLLYAFGWISMKTACRLGFCLVSTFNVFMTIVTKFFNK